MQRSRLARVAALFICTLTACRLTGVKLPTPLGPIEVEEVVVGADPDDVPEIIEMLLENPELRSEYVPKACKYCADIENHRNAFAELVPKLAEPNAKAFFEGVVAHFDRLIRQCREWTTRFGIECNPPAALPATSDADRPPETPAEEP